MIQTDRQIGIFVYVLINGELGKLIGGGGGGG